MIVQARSLKWLMAAVTLALFLGGCGIMIVPDQVPAQKDARERRLAGVSLTMLYRGQKASVYPILTSTGVDVGYAGDLNVWSKKLAEALGRELARKGAELRTNAHLKLTVSVTGITLLQTGEAKQFTVKVWASSSGGWSKHYEASAEITSGVFETQESMTNRLAGLSLARVIKVMLEDRDFLVQLGAK
jgi:hypothetical protein